MTQATVNAGNNTAKNLNPNAQLFSTSDYNNGTVLAGSTGLNDEPYGDYLANGTGPYLQSHQPQLYQVDPSSIDTLHSQQQQQQQQQQPSDSNFVVHEHAAMLETMDHPQPPMLNPNHLHHPQTHLHQTMPDEEQVQQQQQQQQQQFSPEQLRQHLKKQLEYYFSRENMVHDTYLKSQMDAEDYVPITIIANFKLVKRLTHDLQLIIDVLKELPSVEVDAEDRKVRSTDDKRYTPTRKRCIIILRDVPLDAAESEVSDLFLNENCPVPSVSCERALESGTSDCWYVTFNSEDDAQNAFLYLTRENVSIRGQKVLARMKARLWQKPLSVPSTNPSTPVSPPMLNNNGSGATSPPPSSSSATSVPVQQSQLPIQTYPNSTFIQQQGPIQYAPLPQTQFNQQQIPPPQQQQQQQSNQQQAQQQPSQHPSVYSHPNQPSILGNLQTQPTNYRHPIHSSIAQSQHLPTQFSAANQSQHPTSLDHAQVLQQHLRMSYQNYATNPPFDRATWSAPHPQSVQANQPTISFATTAQQPNISSYPASLHQQPQFIAANHPVFSQGNLWYMPSAYQTAEPYPTMAYNGSNKPKNRMPREYPSTSKSRNSTKPTGARNSRHEGLQMPIEHPNELLDYCQHSTPHSEGSSSPVPRAEAVNNRPTDSLQSHVPTYSTNPIDTSSTNDTIDQYHHQSTNESLYNPSNSHLQQQGSTDTSSSQEQILANDNSKLNYQPLEQRKSFTINQDSQQVTTNDNQTQSQQQQQQQQQQTSPPQPPQPQQQQQQQQQPPQQSSKKTNSQQPSIPPLMSRENRSTQNSNRQTSQQGRSQQQQQQQRMNSNSSAPITVNTSKVSSATFYNQTSSSSPQSPNTNPKNQQPVIDNSGPRTYADMLKLKQAPQQQQQQQQQGDSTKSPPNETNDLSSSRAQSPANTKTDSVSVTAEGNGPLSSASSDISPSNPTEPSNLPQTVPTNDSNAARRNSSASDHPQQQHSSSPSHQQYSNSRGRGGGRGNYRYSNVERRSGSNNSLNRGGGGGGGRGENRRSVNNNNNNNNNNSNPNTGANGPSGYQTRGGGRGNGRYFDRPRGSGGGNYHNSNQTVHRFTGNTGNVEPQVH